MLMAAMLAAAANDRGSLYDTRVMSELPKRAPKLDPRDKQKLETSKDLHEFRIKGHVVLAHSRKDAIKKLTAQGKIPRK